MSENKIYLTYGPNPKGKGLIAVISQGHPQLGDKEIIVLDIEIVPNRKAAKAWYRKMLVECPWEARN